MNLSSTKLKNHLFSIEAHFKTSIILTFAVPKEVLANFIPPCLTLDTYQDKWAFVAIALVDTKALRPKGFPSFLGNDFFLIGYRIFVRYTTTTGKQLRGLYIIKSETNKKTMEYLGNIFTHYQYTTTDIVQAPNLISSAKSDFLIEIAPTENEIALPQNSPFATWKEARTFAGPLPFTFYYNAESNDVLIIEGVRHNWIPKPLAIKKYEFKFLETCFGNEPILANAFMIENIDYYWKKGRVEQWKP